MGNLIKGQDMMLFLDNKSIAFATNHTLEISVEGVDVSNKDTGGGDWSAQEAGIISWTATSDNLFSLDGEGDNYEDIFDLLIAKTPIDCIFAKKSQASTVTEVPTGGWTAATNGYKGKAIITNLSLNAPNGEYTTYTVSLQGVGALEKNTQ